MGKLELSNKEIELLKKIHRYTHNDSMRENRIRVVLLYNKEMSKTEIKEILLLDLQTIRRYINDFQLYRMDSIDFEDRRKSRSGNRRGIDQKEEERLSEYIKENTIRDAKEVQQYLKEKLGLEYSLSGVTNLLHHLGFVYKRVVVIPQKSNTAKAITAQLEFEKEYQKLQESIEEEDKIFFLDGVHPTHNTKAGYAWIEKGKEKIIESNTGRSRINLNGAYDVLSGDVVVMPSDTVNSNSTIELFDQMLDRYDKTEGNLYCISDNARYYKSHLIQDTLKEERYKRIKMIFLPPYSPNLNPIERVWKFFKKEVLENRFYPTFKEFEKAIEDFFQKEIKEESMKEKLRRFASDNFHIRRDVVCLAYPPNDFQLNYFGK